VEVVLVFSFFEVLHESPLGVREWNCSYSEIADIVSSMLVDASLVRGFLCLPALNDLTMGPIFSKRLRCTSLFVFVRRHIFVDHCSRVEELFF